MKHAVTLGAAALALMLGAATASAQTDTTQAAAADAPPQARPRRNPNRLTADEIAASHESTAYDAVARLRSRWLRDRPGNEPDETGDPVAIQVYRNGQMAGGVDALREITAGDVDTIEWVAPMQARTRFGPRAAHGAIVVTDKH